MARHALRGKPGIDLSKRGVDLRPLGEQNFLLCMKRCKLLRLIFREPILLQLRDAFPHLADRRVKLYLAALQLVKLLDRAAQLRDLRAQSV